MMGWGGRNNGHKFNARWVEVDGIRFPSAKQAQRYRELKVLEKAGEILDLSLEVSFPIEINGVKICDYRADFVYKDAKIGWTVEDVKGFLTDVYKLKKKMFEAAYPGIKIMET